MDPMGTRDFPSFIYTFNTFNIQDVMQSVPSTTWGSSQDGLKWLITMVSNQVP